MWDVRINIIYTPLYWHLPGDRDLSLKRVGGLKFVYDLRLYYAHACRCKWMTTSAVRDINDTTFVKTKLRVLPEEEVYLCEHIYMLGL